MKHRWLLGIAAAGLVTPLIIAPILHSPFQMAKVLFFFGVTSVMIPILAAHHKDLHRTIRHPLVLSHTAFLVWISFTSAVGVDPFNSFFGNTERATGIFLSVFMLSFSLFLVFVLTTVNDAKKYLLNTLIGVAVIVSLYGILESISIVPTMADAFFPRASSLFGNPISFANFLTIPLFLSLLRVNKKTPLTIFPSIVIFLGILASGTRGALLGVILGSILILAHKVLSQSKHEKRVWIGVAVSAAILILAFGGARVLAPEGSTLYRATHFSDENISTRLLNWDIALNHWSEHLFFGVGHQNYYIIADTHFNPEIYSLSNDWIDKPHNAFLEVLVSSGIVGLILFIAVFIIAARSIFHSSHSRHTKSLLLAALVAYATQIFFIFDTPSALLTLYFLFALIISTDLPQTKLKRPSLLPGIFAAVIMGLLAIFFYLPTTSFLVSIAQNNLQKANDQSFIYDLPLLADKYQDALQNNPTDNALFEETILVYQKTLERHPQKAQHWYGLSHAYVISASATQEPLAEQALSAAQTTEELAPNRIEPLFTFAYNELLSANLAGAIEIMEKALKKAPEDGMVHWILSQFYLLNNEVDQAAEYGLKAIQRGITLTSAETFLWMAEYFAEQGRYEDVVSVYKKAVRVEPDNFQLLPGLAAAYAASGDIESAIQTAELLRAMDPDSNDAVEAFLESLQ